MRLPLGLICIILYSAIGSYVRQTHNTELKSNCNCFLIETLNLSWGLEFLKNTFFLSFFSLFPLAVSPSLLFPLFLPN